MPPTTCAIAHPTVFLNRSSGLDSEDEDKVTVREHLEEACDRAGIVPSFEFVQQGANVESLAREAVARGADSVVAGGGDGTLRAVAGALADTGVTMGILPVGTLNHFARDLNIPLDVERAADNLVTGRIAEVDLGEVNGRVFINNSIIGLYPNYRFIKHYEERKGKGRLGAFLWAVLTVFRRYPFLTLRFHMNGNEVLRRTPFVLIANNEHEMEGYRLGTRSSISEGHLWVYIMRRTGRWGLLRMVLSLALGTFSKDRDFDIYRTKELWIEGRQRRLGVSLDGEIELLDMPLHYRTLPKALKVIVPQERAVSDS
jgi:diacylglycerol kinase family enzyme